MCVDHNPCICMTVHILGGKTELSARFVGMEENGLESFCGVSLDILLIVRNFSLSLGTISIHENVRTISRIKNDVTIWDIYFDSEGLS